MRNIPSLMIALAFLLAACSSGAQASQPTLSTQVEAGQRLFSVHCASCHSTLPDTVIVGPSLAGVAARADTRLPDMSAQVYLEQSILDPQAYLVDGYKALMPTNFGQTLEREQIHALVEYLLTLD